MKLSAVRRRTVTLVVVLTAFAAGILWTVGHLYVRDLTRPFTRLAVPSANVTVYTYNKLGLVEHADGTEIWLQQRVEGELAAGWTVHLIDSGAEIEVRDTCVAVNGVEYKGEEGKGLSVTICEGGLVLENSSIAGYDRWEWWVPFFLPLR
jgi:hypothetical protein